jgi:phospholipid transport system substrate-binding protein
MKAKSGLLVGMLLIGMAQAAPYYGPGPGPQMGGMPPAVANPAMMLRQGIDRLLGFLGQDPAPSREALAGFLDSEIAPFFDFVYMTETAGGRLFDRLDDAQQAALVEQVKTSFLAQMTEKLGAYDNQQVRFMPPRLGNDGRTAQISVAIMNPGSYPARLDFRVYRSGDRWRVYDVAANGQSAIVHYRRELQRQVRQQQMQRMRQMQQPRPMMPRPGGYGPMGYGPGPMMR